MFFLIKNSLRSLFVTFSCVLVVSFFLHYCVSPTVYEHSVFYFSQVRFVVDGDTLVLVDGRKVRLVGIDTPESYFSDKLTKDSLRLGESKEEIMERGVISKEIVQKLISSGSLIGLMYDSFSESSYFKDKYGRYLAYVYVPLSVVSIDNLNYWKEHLLYHEIEGKPYVCLNAYLLYTGFARVFRRFDFDRKESFLFLEKQARKKLKGHWKSVTDF